MRGLLIIIAGLSATGAWADTPFYAGAGWGWTKIQQDGELGNPDIGISHKVDETGDGLTLFAGYEVNERWAIEVGYIDFGEADSVSDLSFDAPPPVGTVFRPDASRLVFEIDGYYVNGQYHVPIGSFGSLDLIGGWFFADGEAKETRLFKGGPDPLDAADSDDKNGAMLGLAYTQKLTNTIYARGSLYYFDIDYSGVIEEPIRFGVDVIWDF